jgi:2-polyprenyl-6-methoxyphenol hydroxylase-like FAD-dependent oxidoreductase
MTSPIERLKMITSPAAHRREHAIVIGASMAGLLAARVLSDHFREVSLLEADEFPSSAVQRRGVPQGPHSHALLAGGLHIFEKLFPGFCDDLSKAGATKGDVGGQVLWFMEGARLRKVTTGIEAFGMTRPSIDQRVRERIREIPNIRIVEKSRVDSLAMTVDRSHVIGVVVNSDTLRADLVVDASGRGSQASRWLEACGYERPQEDKVEIELRYTTRLFRRRPDDLNGDTALIIGPTPLGKRAGLMIAQEGQRWIVTLITYFGEPVETDLAGFIEFARTLPAPFIYDLISHAEPVGEPHTTRFPASVRRRFENLKRFPTGFLILGDALSSFNPMYGQGMSVAAKEALELDTVLKTRRRNVSRRFFLRAAKIIDSAWNLAACNDLRIPEATGDRTFPVRMMMWYVPQLLRASRYDGSVMLAFLKAQAMLIPPTALLHPSIAVRVLRAVAVNALQSRSTRRSPLKQSV